jgi:hypothetical protein
LTFTQFANGGGGGSPGGGSGQIQFNNSGAFGGLTDVQVTARIQSFTGSLSGAAPASGGGTTNFLRADGTWVTPSAAGIVFTPPSGPVTINFSILQNKTGQFFENSGAIVDRFNDRVFIGNATLYTPATCCAETGTWLAALNLGGLNSVSSMVYMSNQTGNTSPLFVAAHSGANTSAGATIYPIALLAANDSATLATSVWGLYGEVYQLNSTVGQATGIEMEVRNVGGLKYVADPYHFGGQSTTPFEAGCGAGQTLTTNNCSTAFLIFPNLNPFDGGIVFTHGSLSTNGANGLMMAIEMDRGHTIGWYGAAGALTDYIQADTSNNILFVAVADYFFFNPILNQIPAPANTFNEGLALQNTGAASSGNQRFSPQLRLSGNGWSTNSGGLSQQVDFTMTNVPQQGAAAPIGILEFQIQVNNAGYALVANLDSFGVFSVQTGYQIANTAASVGHYLSGNGSYYVDNGATGVNCSGSPTSGFASVLGIVTHC